MRKTVVIGLALVVALGVVISYSRGRGDQQIVTDIKAKMFSDAQLKSTALDVQVKSGEVTLRGEVPTATARYDAFKLASDTAGVKKVNDQMTVAEAEAAAASAPTPEPEERPATKPVRRTARRETRKAAVRETPPPAPATAAPAASTAPPAATTEQVSAATTPPPPPPPQPRHVEIQAGTEIRVRMIDSVDSEVNHPGEIFKASLDAPIVVDNEIVVPAGADVYAKLVDARSAGHMTGRSELKLELVRMEFQGKSYPLVSSEYAQAGASRGKRTAATVGGGAVLGTLIGAIAGGGKGAAIGAAAGAGAGTVAQAATKGQQIKIPSETKLDFRLEQPVEVSYFPEKNQTPSRRKP